MSETIGALPTLAEIAEIRKTMEATDGVTGVDIKVRISVEVTCQVKRMGASAIPVYEKEMPLMDKYPHLSLSFGAQL